MTTHHARYFVPGIMVSETWEREIKHRDPQVVAHSVPPEAYAFQLFDLPDPIEGYTAKPINESSMYYVGGEVLSLVEVERREAASGGLRNVISNMKGNGHDRVIITRAGQWMPFRDGDSVV